MNYLCHLSSINCSRQCMVINDATPSNVDDAGALFDPAEGIIIEHTLQQQKSLIHAESAIHSLMHNQSSCQQNDANPWFSNLA